MRYRWNTGWLAVLLLALPSFASAQQGNLQVVHGRLLDDATRQPIVDGAVSLVAVGGKAVATALTDSLGRFRLVAPRPGEFRLKAERIGYQTAHSGEFTILTGDAINMDFWLSTNAVLLAPVEVRASARPWIDRYIPAGLDPFYERMQWYAKTGGGVFLTRAHISDWDAGSTISSMLGMLAGAKSDGNGGVELRQHCLPTIYINGFLYKKMEGETLDRLFSPADLEAVEVYKGASSLPPEFGGTNGACAIVLWTRRTR